MKQSRIQPSHFLWLVFGVQLVVFIMCVAFYIYVGHRTSEWTVTELKRRPKEAAERARIQSETDIERLRSTTLRWLDVVDNDSRYLASEREFITQSSLCLIVGFMGTLTLLVVTIYVFHKQQRET
ncbi:MAG TPA: hypothetical protein VL171_05795 [Verrucomicrobiae bacterium]|nr:hypothetical protein [Verrucomicrobiae bacterium]